VISFPKAVRKCFPLSYLKDSALSHFQERYSDESITKEDVSNYIYALLHHPGYRERYAENLKRELPRIPFAADFHAFAIAGTELALFTLSTNRSSLGRLNTSSEKTFHSPSV
jgi:predicted helicase